MRNIFAVLCLILFGFGCEVGESGQCADTTGPDASCVVAECETNADCADGDPCTQDTCDTATGKCDHEPVPDCTMCKPYPGNPECDDGNPCTTDSCILVSPTDNVGKCDHVPVEGCTIECTTDVDCDDGDLCTTDSCVQGKGCVLEQIENCFPCAEGKCTSGATGCYVGDKQIFRIYMEDHCDKNYCLAVQENCDDGDLSTSDGCDATVGLWGECTHQKSCDDGDACTVDSKATDSTCLHAAVDFGPGYYCEAVEFEATAVPVPAECVDGNVCTEDYFNKQTGLCWWQSIVCMDPVNYHCQANDKGEPICIQNDYCESGEECADENPCNYDYCLENKCRHAYYWVFPGCCWAPPDTNPATGEPWSQFERQVYADGQCTDHNECTWPDHCDMETNKCLPGLVVPECTTCFSDTTCDDGVSCTKDWCDFSGKCQYQFILGCGTEVCDGVDNDYDGLTDEDDPHQGEICIVLVDYGTGAPPVPSAGSLVCHQFFTYSGMACDYVCQEQEFCGDGIDNNCNGQVDEGCTS